MRLLLALLLAFGSASPAAARGIDFDIPAEARASANGFAAAIVQTADLDGFANAWGDLRPVASYVTNRAARGRDLHVVVIFQGCRPAADGKCNVSGHFTYFRPDGSEASTLDIPVSDRPPHANGSLMLGAGPIMVLDPPDPMGQWTLRAEIRDNVSGTTLTVRTPVIVDTPSTASAAR